MANKFLEILKKTAKIVVSPTLFSDVGAIKKKVIKDDSTAGIVANTITGIPNATANVFKDILQGVARSVGTVGITAGNVPSKIASTITGKDIKPPFESEIPTSGNKFSNILFGGQPIRDLPTAGKVATERANVLASAVVGRDVKPVGESFGLPLAVGGILLDLTGFGGKAGVKSFTDEIPEAFLKYVAKEKSPTVIEDTLKSIGLDDINAKNLSSKLAPTKSVDEVKTVLSEFGDTPKQENIFNNILKSPENVKDPIVPKTGVTEAKLDETAIIPNVVDNALPEAKLPQEMAIKTPMTSEERTNILLGNEDLNKPVETEKEASPELMDDLPKELEKTQKEKVAESVKETPKSIKEIEPEVIKEEFETRVSEVDKLIASGDIRVVSRNGRDVYQYKKGGEWVNARDEDSAIKQVTKEPYQPKPKEYAPKDQEKIDGTKAMLENIRERLAEHPAKPLLKFIDKKEGEFLDFKNPNYAKSRAEEVKIIEKNRKIMKTAQGAFEGTQYTELFDDPDTIREVIDDYRYQRQVEKSLVATKNDLLKTLVPIKKTTSLEKIPQKQPQEISPIDTTEGEGRSIELQSQQALQALESESFGLDVSLPNIIENTVTNVKHKVHLIDTYLTTPHFVMEKIGFGKEAEMLRDAMDSYWKELPKNIEVITKWSKEVSKDGNKNIFKFLDGEAITLKPEDKKVALEIKDWLKEWAIKLKLPEDNTITHYITHIFDEEFINKEFDEELAKIISDKLPGQVYDPFLLKRLGKKGYKQDTWLALDAYIKRATRKVHMDPVLETIRNKAGGSLDMSNIEKSQFNYIKKYIDNINMRPSDKEEALDNFIKSIVGYKFGQRPITRALKLFRQATFRGMLGLNLSSALRNVSQGINTYATLGEKYTAIGYLKLFSKGASEELAREGILNAGFVQDRALSATKKAIEKFDKVLFFFFQTAEKINRGSAYFGAKAKYYSRNTKKVDGKIVMPENIEQDAIKYAKNIVRKTQFVFDSIDTPVGMSSDIAKTLTQFQTFTTKQIEFLTHMAKDKNYWGLVRYAIGGMAFVYTIGKAFGMEPREILPWYRFQIPPSLKFPWELSKAIVNAPDKYGQPRDLSKKIDDVSKSAIGLIPAGSQIKKTIEGIKSVDQGGSFDKGGRLQFIQGQSIEEKAQSVLFGKYASDEAQNYFDKSEINKKEMKKIEPIYEEVQALVQEGREEEARAIMTELSDEEYELYKKYKTAEKSKKTLEGKKAILPKYLEIQELRKTNEEKAKVMLSELSDEEYEYYGLVKKQIEKDLKASAGTMPKYDDGEAQTAQSVIGTVFTYAKAIGADPVTAFNRIFTRQKIRYVAGGAIVVERLSLDKSQEIKEKRGGLTSELKLDHTIPLQLGGSNSEDNLGLVPTEIWESYTPVENFLGRKLRNKELNKKEVQDLIIKFKSGEMTAEEVYSYTK